MTRTLLLRGMLAGLIAGLLVFAFARVIGEPHVERAIAMEAALDQEHENTTGHAEEHSAGGHEDHSEPEVVSRSVQRSAGLLTGSLVFGTAIGGLFGLVFAFSYGRLGPLTPRALSATLAVFGYVAIVLVPSLKYPANPPAVGNANTIGIRTGAYFLLIAFSIAAVVLTLQLRKRLTARIGGWNSSLLAAALYIVIMALVAHFMPPIDEVPPGFPASLLWSFRTASLEIQAVLWTTLGLLFGYLTERDASTPIR